MPGFVPAAEFRPADLVLLLANVLPDKFSNLTCVTAYKPLELVKAMIRINQLVTPWKRSASDMVDLDDRKHQAANLYQSAANSGLVDVIERLTVDFATLKMPPTYKWQNEGVSIIHRTERNRCTAAVVEERLVLCTSPRLQVFEPGDWVKRPLAHISIDHLADLGLDLDPIKPVRHKVAHRL